MKIQAIVKRKRRIRAGRGFSRGELREVNISVKEALKLRIPVDIRRSTRHDENINILKSFLAESLQAEKAPTPVKERKKGKGKEVKVTRNLTQVHGIGEKRAQQLKNIGIDSIEKLVEADPKEVSKSLGFSEKSVSKWISNAKQVLSHGEKLKDQT